MKTKITVLGLIAFIAGCSSIEAPKEKTTIALQNFETFIKSDINRAKYKYSDVYFSDEYNPKPINDFKTDFSKCHSYQVNYIKSKSQGYLVLKSLGKSDQEIVSNGVMDCLFVNNWTLYQLQDDKLKRLRFAYLKFPIEEKMTNDELAKSNKELEERKNWYREYAPEELQ